LEAARLATEGDEALASFGKSKASFSIGDRVRVSALLVSGQFPNVNQLIPREPSVCVTLPTLDAIKACHQTEIFARNADNVVRLSCLNGQANFASSASEVGSGDTSVQAAVEGGDISLAFNVKFLLDAFNACGTPQVRLEMTKPESPVKILPVGEEPREYTQVLMPMKAG
jgi:DNA polymerase-3 subunit beta